MGNGDHDHRGVDRREFVKAGVGVAAAAALAGRATASPTSPTTGSGAMPMVKLPRGGITTSVFGYGCPYVGQFIRQGKVDDAKRLIRYAYDRGVRHFDSGIYYQVDEVVGAALADVREHVFLVNKTFAVGPDYAKLAREHVEATLRNYHTDVIDCMLVHNAFDYDNTMRVLDVLDQTKREGKITLVGLSTHVYFDVAHRVIDTGRLDQVLLARGYFPKGFYELLSPRNMELREMAVARAHSLGMNITGMKTLGSIVFSRSSTLVPDVTPERRAEVAAAALRWAYSDPRFHTFAIGLAGPEDVDDNIRILSGDRTVTDHDRMVLAEHSSRVWGAERIRAMETPFAYPDSPRYIEPAMREVLARFGLELPS